ncbi:MAG: tungstate ABC transporter substrate-binding protein WtpA [Thermoleophilia bacterium]|nr:tungstate ABC transporter substrate-binding protein WtpA [Thermoleophilia bacterium]
MLRRQLLAAGRLVATALTVGAVLLCPGCDGGSGVDSPEGGGSGKTRLRVLFAGSLIIPFAQLEQEFEAAHPEIDVNMEGHGSIQAVRIVGDLHEQADVVITADYRLIPMLLYVTEDPDAGRPYADWSIMFATNEMALAYTPDSAFADEVTDQNWFEVINREGVRLGISDPRIDANGYRALMTVKLAEDYYDRPDLFSQTFGGVFRVPIRAIKGDAGTLISVPEVLETKSGSHVVLRPYSVNLLPLLESGDIDYAFEYESVVTQHGLQYVSLPPEIHLGDDAYGSTYDAVTVKLDFQRFASVKPEFAGEPIRYGATIPSNARDPEASELLLAFLLGPEGQRIMAENYQPLIVPASTDNFDALPESLKALCAPAD